MRINFEILAGWKPFQMDTLHVGLQNVESDNYTGDIDFNVQLDDAHWRRKPPPPPPAMQGARPPQCKFASYAYVLISRF